jgi:hypothetical protein
MFTYTCGHVYSAVGRMDLNVVAMLTTASMTTHPSRGSIWGLVRANDDFDAEYGGKLDAG